MKCPNCKEIYEDNFSFCPHCGTKNEHIVEPEPEILVCFNCGFESTEFSFCPECGIELLSKSDAKSELIDKANDERYSANWEEAIECYNKAIELDPFYNDLWNGKGDCIDSLGKYEEAIKCYNKAIELDPTDKYSWSMKAHRLFNLERWEEAVDC